MKNKWMKYIALSLVLTGASTSVFAQFPERPSMEERKREVPSPENNAKRTVREFKKEFQLSDKEYDKVYDLYLKYEKNLLPENAGEFRGGMPPRGGMGMPPGGGPGGFGGPDMGGGMGMGMPPGGGFQPDGNFPAPKDMKAMMEEMRKEQEKRQEKAAKTLKKKMKKILKGDQYVQWEEWEAKRKTRRPEPRR